MRNNSVYKVDRVCFLIRKGEKYGDIILLRKQKVISTWNIADISEWDKGK